VRRYVHVTLPNTRNTRRYTQPQKIGVPADPFITIIRMKTAVGLEVMEVPRLQMSTLAHP